MCLQACVKCFLSPKRSQSCIMNEKLECVISRLKCGYLLSRELLPLVTSTCRSLQCIFTYATTSLKSVGLLRCLALKRVYFKHSVGVMYSSWIHTVHLTSHKGEEMWSVIQVRKTTFSISNSTGRQGCYAEGFTKRESPNSLKLGHPGKIGVCIVCPDHSSSHLQTPLRSTSLFFAGAFLNKIVLLRIARHGD